MAKVGNRTESKTGATRDARGHFLPGNPGNPNATGRPPRAIEDQYLTELRAEVTPERWKAIVQRAITDAAGGDQAARTWLGKYLLPDLSRLKIETAGTLAEFLASVISGKADNQ